MPREPLRQPLWSEWDGYEYPETDKLVYFSYGRIDLSRPAQARLLAQTLLWDGVVDSIPEGIRAVEEASSVFGYVGFVGEDIFLTWVTADGEYEGQVDPEPGTWVELEIADY